MRSYFRFTGRVLLRGFCVLAIGLSAAAPAVSAESDLDLDSIPLPDWLSAGETTEIPWRIQVANAELRMDQRLEVTYTATVRGRDLNRLGNTHDLFLISRMSARDGGWLHDPVVTRRAIDREVPAEAEIRFDMRAWVQPGEYVLWLVLYDRETGRRSVAVRNVRVNAMRSDPLPAETFARLPAVEITETSSAATMADDPPGPLSLPVTNGRPLAVEIVSTFSLPEQWADRDAMMRAHGENTLGALAALAQLEPAEGSITITGLDLVGRNVAFRRQDWTMEAWPSLVDAFRQATVPVVSVEALEGRRDNAAFFREYMEGRVALPDGADGGETLRVFIVVSSSVVFERGSDPGALALSGDCGCRVYHLRLQVPPRMSRGRFISPDTFDELGRILQPLRPRSFRVMSPLDLRRAIGQIRQDLAGAS